MEATNYNPANQPFVTKNRFELLQTPQSDLMNPTTEENSLLEELWNKNEKARAQVRETTAQKDAEAVNLQRRHRSRHMVDTRHPRIASQHRIKRRTDHPQLK
ncbi:hypothetical protein WH47_05427 [Habropoda laboriosa]|uniref:Uncharacterized protein n=1 Tax=Habropoda laboriosa TaxID=597456 RepID=A0A0L7QUV0_9HYME|nr:hypothetical protein WH47_05427 [Habropoda laboriosa]